MKLIMAIVKPFKLDEVREALVGAGCWAGGAACCWSVCWACAAIGPASAAATAAIIRYLRFI